MSSAAASHHRHRRQLLLPLPHAPPHKMFVEMQGELTDASTCIIFIHGGPGYHTNPCDFDPFLLPAADGGEIPDDVKNENSNSCVVEGLFLLRYDQRFSGKSYPSFEPADGKPHGDDIIDVQTQIVDSNFSVSDLVQDLEYLRCTLLSGAVGKVVLCGHSWGCTLALAYAATHPQHCAGLLLFGTYLADDPGHVLVYGEHAGHAFPQARRLLLQVGGIIAAADEEGADRGVSWQHVFGAYRPKILRNFTFKDEEDGVLRRQQVQERLPIAIWLLYEDYVTAASATDRAMILDDMKRCCAAAASAPQDPSTLGEQNIALLNRKFLRLRGQSTLQIQLLRHFAESKFDFLGDENIHRRFAQAQVPILFLQGEDDDCCPMASLKELVAKLKHAGCGGTATLRLLRETAHDVTDLVKTELLVGALRIQSLLLAARAKKADG